MKRIKPTLLAGVAVGIFIGGLLMSAVSVVASDSTSVPPPNVNYQAPTATTATYAGNANYATNAGNADTANYATSALNCLGTPTQCGNSGNNNPPPPPTSYYGTYVYSGNMGSEGCGGGPPPPSPLLSDADQAFSAPGLVPQHYNKQVAFTTACCHQWAGVPPNQWCSEPDIVAHYKIYDQQATNTTAFSTSG